VVRIDEFWSIVEQARADARITMERFEADAVGDALVARLTALSLDEILDFDGCFDEVIGPLDTREVELACNLITGYLSDDSFTSFTAGLVALGREAVEQITSDPDSLAGHAVVTAIAEGRLDRFALDSEGMLFAALNAYTELSDGDDDTFWYAVSARREAAGPPEPVSRPAREPEDADTVLARIPRLTALFPVGRWADDEPELPTPEPDPHEGCPVCRGALATHTAGSSSREPDGSFRVLEFRRCLSCWRIVSRGRQGEIWGRWGEADPADVDVSVRVGFDLLVPPREA
jgi:hypothetical protein